MFIQNKKCKKQNKWKNLNKRWNPNPSILLQEHFLKLVMAAQRDRGKKVLTHQCAFLPCRGAQAAIRVRATAISARWTIRQFTANPVHSSEKGRSCNNNNINRWKKTGFCGSGCELNTDSIGSADPDQGGQKWPTKVEIFLKFHVLKCWMFSFESGRLLL